MTSHDYDEYIIGDRKYKVTRFCDKCGEPIDMEFRGMEFYHPCECVRKQKAQSRINAIRKKGLTDASMLSMRFENDKEFNPSICKKAREYASHFGSSETADLSIMFTGDVGTGKTFYAGCIANALIDRGIFVFMTTLSRIIESGFDDDYRDALRTIEAADLVIFDDVGSERDTEFANGRVFEAIDTRVRSGKPMIVTTNLPPKAMMECADLKKRRVYDRIIGACAIIPVTGPSIRRRLHDYRQRKFSRMFGG